MTVFAWTYSASLVVNSLSKPRAYQHLESSGNRSLALGKAGVAVVWEDNRSGEPEVYIAYKSHQQTQFTPAQRVSKTGPAYEPAVAALADGRFVVAWEAKDHIWARIVSASRRGPVQRLSRGLAREATLTVATSGRLWLAWAAKAARHFHIVVTSASVQGERLQLSAVRAVDPKPPRQDQLYPSLAVSAEGTTVAWEDRRYGHTRLFTAFATPGKGFTPLRQLNQLKRRRAKVYGNGTGAMRVVLAGNGHQELIASWLDKRDFAEGYDVYAAFSHDGGKHFGANEKVEDAFGANQAQWHAVSAMDRQGHAVVAWDDQRNGNPDTWMSWRNTTAWSDDDSPGVASGRGSQTHPAIAFDTSGRLHMAFIEQKNGISTIRYLVATPAKAQFGSLP